MLECGIWPIVPCLFLTGLFCAIMPLCFWESDSALARARSLYPSPLQVPYAASVESAPLALAVPASSSIFSRQRTGTGFFVDDSGRLVTALHVVAGCARVAVAKEGYRLVAEVMARSGRHDLALLQVPRTLGLAAVFPDSARADPRDMVFVAGYDALPSLQTGRDVLANATVAGHGEDGELALDSSVSHGASGAPVLDSQGLVQGVISRRTTSGRVLAISAGDTKAFLAANGVGIAQDDRAQIAPLASRANRAASISARVICLLQ